MRSLGYRCLRLRARDVIIRASPNERFLVPIQRELRFSMVSGSVGKKLIRLNLTSSNVGKRRARIRIEYLPGQRIASGSVPESARLFGRETVNDLKNSAYGLFDRCGGLGSTHLGLN